MESQRLFSRRPMPKYDGDIYTKAYDEGYEAASKGIKEDQNPYKPSGHERDTTIEDNQYYYWWLGWMDWE